MSINSSSQLTEFLDIHLNGASYTLSQMDSGGTNSHYKVILQASSETNDPPRHWFLKVFITNSLQVVDRQQQFQIQQQVAHQGLAPQPLALSACGNYWLEHWCSPQLSDGKHANASDEPGLLARAIAQVHHCRVTAPDLDIKAEWLRYLAVAGQDPEGQSLQITRLLADYQSVDEHQNTFCFCHNDLHRSHILSAQPLRIVDWEYSAIGNRYFDLAACAMVNEFDKNQLEKFIDRYSVVARIPKSTVADGIQRLLPVVDFTNELWHNAYNTIS